MDRNEMGKTHFLIQWEMREWVKEKRNAGSQNSQNTHTHTFMRMNGFLSHDDDVEKEVKKMFCWKRWDILLV